jgi:hypothetical protein
LLVRVVARRPQHIAGAFARRELLECQPESQFECFAMFRGKFGVAPVSMGSGSNVPACVSWPFATPSSSLPPEQLPRS